MVPHIDVIWHKEMGENGLSNKMGYSDSVLVIVAADDIFVDGHTSIVVGIYITVAADDFPLIESYTNEIV